jgi:hypothetical protein
LAWRLRTSIDPPAAGLSQRSGQTIIDVGRFFSGSQMSLYVTVRKER